MKFPFIRTGLFCAGLALGLSTWASPSENRPDPLASVLNATVSLPEFGDIRYRGPKENAAGPVIVLFHGIYGGATHRAFRELLPLLEAQGARVYSMDLPGAGESAKPKRLYDIEALDRFVGSFLKEVVKEPAVVVAESLLGQAVLRASTQVPNQFRRIVLLSPAGFANLREPPSERENALFERIWNDEAAGKSFYDNLLSDNSLRFFLAKAYYNDALVNEERLEESRLARRNPEQRWLTFNFVAGKFFRPFEDAAKGVFIPTLAIFGANAEAVGYDPSRVERPEPFRQARPDFEFLVIEECGQAVQREKPQRVADAILKFAQRD